jgi:ribosomal protein S18 acetylase RimI-like enzyme
VTGRRLRPATSADVTAFAQIWAAAVEARAAEMGIDEQIDAAEFEEVVHEQFDGDAFPVVLTERAADGTDTAVAIGVGRPALERDGAGPGVVPGLAHLSMIAVAPQRWGGGAGRAIVSALLDTARQRGYERAQLWVQEANERAQSLYRRMGFRPVGRTMDTDSGLIGLWEHPHLRGGGTA